MEPRDEPFNPAARFDPAKWEFHIRRSGGCWLTRPAPVDDAPVNANQETWSRRLGESWPFDTAAEARAAALAWGAPDHDFAVIPAPRDPAAWLAAGRRAA